jgi:ketol-acid reductoisomerase
VREGSPSVAKMDHMPLTHTFNSATFPVETVELNGHPESYLQGGRHLFPLLPRALAGIETIGVIGWGSQGPAQAQNLRESLEGTGIEVVVGLREGSKSADDARRVGFTEAGGTLGEMLDVVGRSDLVLLLISDGALAQLYPRIFATLKPGATIGLSHGFLLAHLRTVGDSFPEDHNVIAVCPKGMGPSVRRLYEQGREVNGAGINTSFAVERDVDGRATDIALGWSVALGAPYTFMTTMESEYRSDIFGERGILLGAVHGIVESLYRRFVSEGASEDEAFERACESITGPISETISHDGLLAIDEYLDDEGRQTFRKAYEATYPASKALLVEIYDEVSSGNEIRSVVAANRRLEQYPMPKIEGTQMWSVGADVRAKRGTRSTPIDPYAAGVFCGAMTAQIDVLLENGHPYSEIANESVIESVDSLLPYMHARGVAYMVDNCSTTARLGARKWGPRFEAQLDQVVFPATDDGREVASELPRTFREHEIHEVLDRLSRMRPSVDISVV